MNNLFDFLRKYFFLFLFLILEVVSFVIMFRFNNYQGTAWLTAANTVSGGINGMYASVGSYTHLKDVNDDLTQENSRLQMEISALRDQLSDLTPDTSYYARKLQETLMGYQQIPAHVVSNSINRKDNYIVINRGTVDGVRPEMGVVSGTGVVGIVYLTGPHYSLVLPVTNPKSSISCRVKGENYFGYLLWDGGSPRHANVDDIPRYAKVKKGSVVETSGFSAVFPPGIMVGKVQSVGNAPDGQSLRMKVYLATNFSTLRNVAVIATPYKAEVDSLKANAPETIK